MFEGSSSRLGVVAFWLLGLLGPSAAAGVGPRAGLEGGDGAAWDDALRIALFGDSGSGNQDQKAVARQLRRFEDDLRYVICLGDNVYWSGRAERFADAFHEPYRRLLERRTDQGEPQIRFHSALGNHDVKRCELARPRDGSFPPDRDAYVWSGEGCDVEEQLADEAFGYREGRRYYDVALTSPTGALLAELFVLDSNTLPSGRNPSRSDGAQLDWLSSRLQASRERARRTGVEPWRILALHHPIRTPRPKGYIFGKGGHDQDETFVETMWHALVDQGDEDDRLRETALGPLLSQNAVDVVIAGHNHLYARLVPGPDRIRHFVAGGGGIAVYEPDMGSADVAVGGGFHHFVTAVLTPDRFEYCTVDSLGRVRDHGYWLRGRPQDEDRPLETERFRAVCRP